jgi:hypothetical protein
MNIVPLCVNRDIEVYRKREGRAPRILHLGTVWGGGMSVASFTLS